MNRVASPSSIGEIDEGSDPAMVLATLTGDRDDTTAPLVRSGQFGRGLRANGASRPACTA